jgi:hypothetical protein
MSRPPANKIPAGLRERIASRVCQVSTAQVAWECGVSPTTVRNIRDQAGISSRPAGQPRIWGRSLWRKLPHPKDAIFRPRGQRPLEWALPEEAAA